jgi:hypothetical protein
VLERQVGIYPVTRNGNPEGELLGFICSSCLKSSEKMRIYIKSKMSGIEVTQHAVHRYLNRNDGEPVSEKAAKASIIRMFDSARRVSFRNRDYVARMEKRHGPSLHWYQAGWIFITTTSEPYVIKTMLYCRESAIKLNVHFKYARREQ